MIFAFVFKQWVYLRMWHLPSHLLFLIILLIAISNELNTNFLVIPLLYFKILSWKPNNKMIREGMALSFWVRQGPLIQHCSFLSLPPSLSPFLPSSLPSLLPSSLLPSLPSFHPSLLLSFLPSFLSVCLSLSLSLFHCSNSEKCGGTNMLCSLPQI